MRYLLALLCQGAWVKTLEDPNCLSSPDWQEVRESLDTPNWTANVEHALKVNAVDNCILGQAAVTAWRFLGRWLTHDVDGALHELRVMAYLPVPVQYHLLPGWPVPIAQVIGLRDALLRQVQRQRVNSSSEQMPASELAFFLYEHAATPFCEGNFIYDWFRISPFRTMHAETAHFFILQLCTIEDLDLLRSEHMEHFLPTQGRDHVILLPLSAENFTRPRFLSRAIFVTPWGDAPPSAGTEMEPLTLHNFEPHRDILIPLPIEYGSDAERAGKDSPFCVVRDLASYVSALWSDCVVVQLGAFELPFGQFFDHRKFVIRWPADQLDRLANATHANALGFPDDVLRRYQQHAREVACFHAYPIVYDGTSPCGDSHALRLVEELLRRKIRKSKTAIGQVFYVEGKTFTSINDLDPERFK
eukprot:GEMP01042802.1.p1 GENE.GEMP01042802.1~~GEMP01042802.1.p1  ORF type:complete len:416 (+),score=108.02 GEMP01042802.1:19-1266(+)